MRYCGECSTIRVHLRACGYLGEISEHFRHFVASLTTPDVDDDIAVRILR